MRLARLSARSRITLGSAAVAAVLVILALLVVRAQVSAILADADSTLARSDLISFEKDVKANPEEPVDDPGTGVLVFVRDPGGTVQVNTLPHDLSELAAPRQQGDDEFVTTDDEGRTFVMIGKAVSTSAGTWMLWSARSTSSSELALNGLDRVLISGGLILLGGIAAASWIIATLALAPVQAASAREKQMVSDAAHELRTPLAALRTQLELAHSDFGNAEALAEQVQVAEASVDRLTSLASNLLELSRLEARGASDALSTASELVDEFTGSIDRARMLALRKSVSVDFDVTVVDDAARFRIDAQAFGRLVDNVVSNAITAVDRDGAVNATLVQRANLLILTVSDNGPGMPDEFLPIAFERFTRPDSSRTISTGGSGLGLALVQALARDAGGDSTVQNTHPGLQVTVSIPQM
ncbi:MAG: sensor histidine kinase [Rhodoglobus sp.]